MQNSQEKRRSTKRKKPPNDYLKISHNFTNNSIPFNSTQNWYRAKAQNCSEAAHSPCSADPEWSPQQDGQQAGAQAYIEAPLGQRTAEAWKKHFLNFQLVSRETSRDSPCRKRGRPGRNSSKVLLGRRSSISKRRPGRSGGRGERRPCHGGWREVKWVTRGWNEKFNRNCLKEETLSQKFKFGETRG